ncbi:MAG: hypothetical protein ABJ004_08915 [Cyclobacteriaceae bacterium]
MTFSSSTSGIRVTKKSGQNLADRLPFVRQDGCHHPKHMDYKGTYKFYHDGDRD